MPHAFRRMRAALPCVAAVIALVVPAAAQAVDLRGTRSADRLTGTEQSDTLRGGRGADVLDGRGGADRLLGGPGHDRILADGTDRVAGGAGADRVSLVAEQAAFRVDCGRGRDRVELVSARLTRASVRQLMRGCERLAMKAPETDTRPSPTETAPPAESSKAPPAPERKKPQPAPLPTPTPTPTPTPSPSPSATPAPAPDTQPPSVPQGMAWTTKTQTSIGLRWDPSSDNSAVTGYRIYRNDAHIATLTGTSYTLVGLSCGTSYTVGLTAIDAAGNESLRAEATGTTSTNPCSTPTPTPTPTLTPTPTPGPGTPADFFVSTTGSDSNSCTSAAPCRSLARAYAVASSAKVIQVAAGVYPPQTIPGGTKAVTFRGVAGAKMRELDNSADNVTFDGIEVDANFANVSGFENHGADNVTFKNAAIGNVTDEKGALVSGANFTFDSVLFHDAVYRTDGVHMECVYAIVVPGFTVRNSVFRDCAIMDLFFTYGDWWSPLPPAYGNVTIENNVFSHPEMSDNSGWHYYGLYVANNGPSGRRVLDGWTVRHNTFETPAVLPDTGINGSRWVGNLGAWDCSPGVTYRNNVGTKCAASDKQVSPPSSGASTTAPLGWTNPLVYDFHLSAGSPAINAGDTSDAPPTDRDGKLRTGAPDAGAYEF